MPNKDYTKDSKTSYRDLFNEVTRSAWEFFRRNEDALIELCVRKGATLQEVGDVLDVTKQAIALRLKIVAERRAKNVQQ